ncbi:MAG: UvrD-helicase domain-containing protein [Prevotella sp.]|nr:UvrD-helicase domain-containing protein [Prevotella sp.]
MWFSALLLPLAAIAIVLWQNRRAAALCKAFRREDVENFDRKFAGRYVSFERKTALLGQFSNLRRKAGKMMHWRWCLLPSKREAIAKFMLDVDALPKRIDKHNKLIINGLIAGNTTFFDTCLDFPLDRQQRRAIVSEEANCLVVSSAGSGKTASIVGRVKYLVDVKKTDPRSILLISFTNKAAAELTARTDGMRGCTFHKLALDIIGMHTGRKPSICDDTEMLVGKCFRERLGDNDFCADVVEYFADIFPNNEPVSAARDTRNERRFRAFLPDMDGNPVFVRSKQEQTICFVLSSLGVAFRYEEPYAFPLADATHSQYRPDFSIYFEQNGVRQRIYLEHFGVDEHGAVPRWFADDAGISYAEAQQKYRSGIEWKKAVHRKYGTTMLATTSADFRFSDIRKTLKGQLTAAGVPLREKTPGELLRMIVPPESAEERSLIRLISTFISLLKSSCQTLDGVLKQAAKARERHSEFMIQRIFRPMFEQYTAALRAAGQLDFADIIAQATDICRTDKPVAFSHIIVDEFQDISLDRYRLLLALRAGNPPATLFCVGDDWQSIFRFTGSDMALFNRFEDYFGPTEINKLETTYRFGEPLIGRSSAFILRNAAQITKAITAPENRRTDLAFVAVNLNDYCDVVEEIISSVPPEKSVLLLGRYTFDDNLIAKKFKYADKRERRFYSIAGRSVEFLTAHKAKGLEADVVLLLKCDGGVYGFPAQIADDAALRYVLTAADDFPYGEERRLFYVAVTRARIKTWVLFDARNPSLFVREFADCREVVSPGKKQVLTVDLAKKQMPKERTSMVNDWYNYAARHQIRRAKSLDAPSVKPSNKPLNAGKRWTKSEEEQLLAMWREGRRMKEIAFELDRTSGAIRSRLNRLGLLPPSQRRQ